MARDIVLARAIGPYLDRGVVLLAGNGHVRRDIGVPFWLSADAARGAVSIGMLERDGDGLARESEDFDAYVITERAVRTDPMQGPGKASATFQKALTIASPYGHCSLAP